MNPDKIRNVLNILFLILALASIIVYIVARDDFKLFIYVAEYAFTGMRLYVIGFLFAGFNIIGTGYLSASEHAKEAFTASVCRGFVAIAVCSVILSRMFGIRGVWLSFMAAEALTAGITARALLKDHKKEAMA